MSKTPEMPAAGGSYRRQKDGTLKRVAGTGPAEPPSAVAPTVPAAPMTPEAPAEQPAKKEKQA